MLGSIHKDRVSTYQDGQADLIYLVSHVDRVVDLGLRFVFSDRNAVKDYAAFSDDITRLDRFVDWTLMEQKMWNNTAAEPDRMERRMAEFLVYRSVPWDAFLGVGAIDEDRRRQASQILSDVGSTATIRTRPEWYY